MSGALPPNGFQIVSVFRALYQFKLPDEFRERWVREQCLPKPIDWNHLGSSRITPPAKTFGRILRTSNWVLTKLNSISTIVLKSNHEEYFLPGDEFNPDTVGTYWIGLHSKYMFGQAISGVSGQGACSIRCGEYDKVLSDDIVIFHGEASSNMNALHPVRNTMTLADSWASELPVRVLLGQHVWWHAREVAGSQYYLADMYVHFYRNENDTWIFGLREQPKPKLTTDHSACSCCVVIDVSTLKCSNCCAPC